MKTKIAIIVLAAVSLILVIALFSTKKQAEEQQVHDVNIINEFSNREATASMKLLDLGQVNLALTNDLAASRAQLAQSTQQLVQVSNTIATLTASNEELNVTLTTTKESLAATRTQVAGLTMQVSDLETQNKALDQRSIELTNQLARLNAVIEETRSKLAAADNKNDYLQGELQKQLAQRAEIEHRFNDLQELRSQLHKIWTEQFIARRIELNKTDTGTRKGAEMLVQRPSASKPAPKASVYDLNVEVSSDGSVKVIPPLKGTNAPAAPKP
jgi:chromosome segregation ATPase